MAVPLLTRAKSARRLLADKTNDADRLRAWLAERRIQAVISSIASRRTPYPPNRCVYGRRNIIERFFCQFNNWLRIATRYDRYATNCLAGITSAATLAEWAK